MPKSPRRKFNADRFLDKFKCFEGVLRRYCDHWKEGLDGFPEMLTVETFKEWLRSSAGNRVAYKGMLEGIYRAYDMSTKQGHEILMDALEQCGVEIPGVHSLHVEVLALRVLSEYPEVFETAYDVLTVCLTRGLLLLRLPACSCRGKSRHGHTGLDGDPLGRRAELQGGLLGHADAWGVVFMGWWSVVCPASR